MLLVDELLMEWIENVLKKGVKGLREEFLKLQQNKEVPRNEYSHFMAETNLDQNRYRNVICLDKSRVKIMKEESDNDYIHANYISTPYSERRFICTQAPLGNTVADFWYMICQQKTEFIIMLTNFNENGREKSACYFPLAIAETYPINDIVLKCHTCERRMDFPSEIWQRTIEVVLNETDRRIVTHFHWTDWPDHGVPRDFISPLRLLEEAKFIFINSLNFLKTGIGRSGCLLLMEYVLENLQYGEHCADMAAALGILREQRAGLIQNDAVRAKFMLIFH
ncbi:unnamed protein product [Thelazia callipaeda]|uniref:Tyrosine-protein phosphatase domain-containing protein n=1 Tax=Thelazia callipaeda TaxID=103827 RepID=A0A0N5DC45_THECL|nr:unnamed protein product [Thelazia callipaeda]